MSRNIDERKIGLLRLCLNELSLGLRKNRPWGVLRFPGKPNNRELDFAVNKVHFDCEA